MKLKIIGRQMDVPDGLSALFEKKLSKFDKFFNDDAVAHVSLSRVRGMERLELTISSGGTLYRSEEENSTFNNALDAAMDSIERQIRKNKTRLAKRLREGAFLKEDEKDRSLAAQDVPEEPEFHIRTKTFAFKPMTPEEAILEMNLLEHDFFVFTNSENEQVNVVYKRKSGGYGLIVPEK